MPVSALTLQKTPLHTIGPENLVRIPATSKSRFSLLEEHAGKQQRQFTNGFLGSVGLNSDLVDQPRTFRPAPPADLYVPPTDLHLVVDENPEALATDLFPVYYDREVHLHSRRQGPEHPLEDG